MGIEERMNIIKNKAKKDADAKLAAQNAEIDQQNKLMKEIKSLSSRIKDIIALANACNQNGVKIPEKDLWHDDYDSGKKYGYKHEFIAEGICHHTGLIRTWGSYANGTYKYIGIENGGANGCYDLWTDGDNVFYIHEDNRNDKQRPGIRDMGKFLEEFPVFERAFLNWIDSLDG